MEIAFGILGSVASIIGLLLPANGWKQRFVHLVYGLAIIVLAFFAVSYQQKLSRVSSIERAAIEMVRDRDMKYTHSGFIHATLSFLEKNSDLYPDTYIRAVKMCAQYSCDSPKADSIELVNLAFTYSGMLTGLATIEHGS